MAMIESITKVLKFIASTGPDEHTKPKLLGKFETDAVRKAFYDGYITARLSVAITPKGEALLATAA